MTRPIFFLSDFGLSDTYVGIVKAVILGIAPDARIVDLTHDVPARDVRAGALAVLTVAPYLPPDAVVLAVVDPGVGTARRPIAVRVGGRTFVGPDNGLLSWAVRRLGAGAEPGDGEPGGAMNRAATNDSDDVKVAVLDRPRYWLPVVSATFHGRDLFGPVAAHLARGVPLGDVGSPGGAIETIPFPTPNRDQDADGGTRAARGEVIHVDRYGNLITSLRAADLPAAPVFEIRGRRIVGMAPHFQMGAAPVIALVGSAGLLEIAVPNGSAATLLGVGVGAPVTVSPQP